MKSNGKRKIKIKGNEEGLGENRFIRLKRSELIRVKPDTCQKQKRIEAMGPNLIPENTEGYEK